MSETFHSELEDIQFMPNCVVENDTSWNATLLFIFNISIKSLGVLFYAELAIKMDMFKLKCKFIYGLQVVKKNSGLISHTRIDTQISNTENLVR